MILRQLRYYNAFIEKDKKTFFEVLLFLKTHCYCKSQEILFRNHLYMVCLLWILNDQIRTANWMKKSLWNIFDGPLREWFWKWKCFWYALKNTWFSVNYSMQVSLHNICIIYLHKIEACLKFTIGIFYFFHSKNHSNFIRNAFLLRLFISLKKIYLSSNIRNAYVMRKVNLYFLTPWKMIQVFFQMFVLFKIMAGSFLRWKWTTLEVEVC